MNTDIQLTPHFHLREFLHPGAEKELTASIIENLRKLANKLETVRITCGNKPITITSGYRTPSHNKKVGGAPNSWHTKGLAADFLVKGMTADQVRAKLPDWEGGVELGISWVHLDLGPKRRFYP